MANSFTTILREQTDEIWARILAHPFVTGLGDGSLPPERFTYYLGQDYGYLQDYARVMARAAAAADDLEGMAFFSEQLALTLGEEMELHRRTCESYGLSEANLLAVAPHPVVRAYGRYLQQVAIRGWESDILAALLPCAVGYVEIATALRRAGLPEVPAYRDWIETYTSPEMCDLAVWLQARLDQAAEGTGDAARARWLRLYRGSCEFEQAFFEMAWSPDNVAVPSGFHHDPRDWLLYVVTSEEVSCGRSHEALTLQAIIGGARVVQFRDKSAKGRAFLETARALRRLTRESAVSLIVNDRVDVAVAVDADGVHVGQSDLPVETARSLIGPDRILGVSATTLEEALDSDRARPDYIGFGPVFDARATKPDAADPSGLEVLREVCARCRAPVIAIGGIDSANARQVIEAGAVGVAVVSAVTAAPDIAAATRDLLERLRGQGPSTPSGRFSR